MNIFYGVICSIILFFSFWIQSLSFYESNTSLSIITTLKNIKQQSAWGNLTDYQRFTSDELTTRTDKNKTSILTCAVNKQRLSNCEQLPNEIDSTSRENDTNSSNDGGNNNLAIQTSGITFGIFGIFGNSLVILGLYQKEIKIHELLIINQSVIDTLCCLSMILHSVWVLGKEMAYTTISWWLREIQCRIIKGESLLWGLMDVSTTNLCVLTLERYIAIAFPMIHHVHVTKFRAKISLFIPWITGLGFQIICAVNINRMVNDKCEFWYHFVIPNGKKFLGVFFFVVEWLLPIVLLIVCNCHMAWIIHKSRNFGKHTEDSLDNKKIAARNNLFKTLLFVGMGFFACNSWNAIFFLLVNVGVSTKIIDLNSTFFLITIIVYMANPIINPFVYTLQYEHFRRRLYFLLFKCRNKANTSVEEEVSNRTKKSEIFLTNVDRNVELSCKIKM